MFDVIEQVSEKLCDIGRHAAAGELHESVDDTQGAIRVFCKGRLFDRARQLAKGNPTFISFIEQQERTHFVETDTPVSLGSLFRGRGKRHHEAIFSGAGCVRGLARTSCQ